MNAADQRLLGAELLAVIRRDRARRSRSARFRKFLSALFIALLTDFLRALLGGWLFMLAVGVINSEWIPALPTLGYWWSVLIAWLLRSALSTSATAKAGEDR